MIINILNVINLRDINILDLIPQRPPFIAVDNLTYFDKLSAKTSFEITEDNIFCKDGIMEETGLIENIAQTCAAHTSFLNISHNNHTKLLKIAENIIPEQKFTDNKTGVIAMIDSLEISRSPLLGEILETTLTIEEEYFSTTLVKSEIKIENEIIAFCKMKLVLI